MQCHCWNAPAWTVLANSLLPAVPDPTHLRLVLSSEALTSLSAGPVCFQARVWLSKGSHSVTFNVPVMVGKCLSQVGRQEMLSECASGKSGDLSQGFKR